MKRLYKGGQVSPLLHPIDTRDWMRLGWAESPTSESIPNEPTPEPEEETPEEPEQSEGAEVPESLTLINEASSANAITVLPGIGTVSAGLIFTNRPVSGFVSLTAVQAVPGLPVTIDWEVVAVWSAS